MCPSFQLFLETDGSKQKSQMYFQPKFTKCAVCQRDILPVKVVRVLCLRSVRVETVRVETLISLVSLPLFPFNFAHNLGPPN